MKKLRLKKQVLSVVFAIAIGMFLFPDVASSEVLTFSKGHPKDGAYISGEQTGNSISLDVRIPDVEISQIQGDDGTTYHKLSIAGSDCLTKEEGRPQLPYISELVHVPDQAVDLSIQATINGSPVQHQDILVYPSPKTVVKTSEGGFEYLAEEFCLDPATYSHKELIPAKIVEIAEDGYFRSVRMIRVNINPVRYIPASKTLEVAQNIKVTITWSEDQSIQSKRDTTKGFERVISGMILNYEAYGR